MGDQLPLSMLLNSSLVDDQNQRVPLRLSQYTGRLFLVLSEETFLFHTRKKYLFEITGSPVDAFAYDHHHAD